MTIWEVTTDNHKLGYCSSELKVIELLKKHYDYLYQCLDIEEREEEDYTDYIKRCQNIFLDYVQKLEDKQMTLKEFNRDILDYEGIYIEEIELDEF